MNQMIEAGRQGAGGGREGGGGRTGRGADRRRRVGRMGRETPDCRW